MLRYKIIIHKVSLPFKKLGRYLKKITRIQIDSKITKLKESDNNIIL